MNLAARAADLRGNEFQHLRAWTYAIESLTNPDIVSISVEAREGGAFDDIVVERQSHSNTYEQAKSSNYGDKIVDEDWLFSKRVDGGKSPLQHFFNTWRDVTGRGEQAEFSIVTNRGYDAAHPILGRARNNWDSTIDLSKLQGGPRSEAGIALQRWSEHLAEDVEQVKRFLGQLRLVTLGDMTDLYRAAGVAQRAAGLRGDTDAVTVGVNIVRQWVMTGVRKASRAEVAAHVRGANLSDTSVGVHVAVSGIDRYSSSRSAIEVDFVDLYEGDEAQTRRVLRSPESWTSDVVPRLREVASLIEGYGVHSVQLEGHARLPMWFALGRTFPLVRKWLVSTVQDGSIWDLEDADEVSPVIAREEADLGGTDLAVLVELSFPAADVLRTWIDSREADIGAFMVLQSREGISNHSVPDATWLMGWVEGARKEIMARLMPGQRVHLFLSAPAAAALALGYKWNLLPETVVYEYLPQERRYSPIFSTM